MQRTAEIEPFFSVDMGSPDGDYTALVVRLGNRILDTFIIPPELLGPTFSGVGSYDHPAAEKRRAALRRYVRLLQEVWHLRTFFHVSESILDRVMRLNPDWEEGTHLRGVRRSHDEIGHVHSFATPKGEFIQRHGREAFEAIPHHLLVKRGRRRWVTATAVRERIWEIYQGCRRVDFVMVADGPGFFGDMVSLRAVPWAEFAATMGFAAD